MKCGIEDACCSLCTARCLIVYGIAASRNAHVIDKRVIGNIHTLVLGINGTASLSPVKVKQAGIHRSKASHALRGDGTSIVVAASADGYIIDKRAVGDV